jgi:hypothetical protein
MSQLAAAIQALQSLNYDELRDLRDCIDYRLYGHAPRHGRPPSIEVLYEELEQGITISPNLLSAFQAMAGLPADAGESDDLEALRGMVETLADALAPQEQRRSGKGYITTRTIPRLKWNPGKGLWEIRTYGPYAYLRRWATGGNRDHKRRILKSYYLGKDIALLYLAGKLSTDIIIEAFETGKLDTLQKNARKYARRLPDEVRLIYEPPAIEFDPAPQLLEYIEFGDLTASDLTKIYSTSVLEGIVKGWISHQDVYEHYASGTLDMLKAAITQRLDIQSKADEE